MASGKYSFIIEQGATTDFEVQYKDSSGSPVDLSLYHARMQIREDFGGTLIANLSSSLDTDGTGLNLTFEEAKYDLELVTGSTVIRLLEGKVKLSKNVTV